MPPTERHESYSIAWVSATQEDHQRASRSLEPGYTGYTSSISNITYTLGRIGAHNVVLASPSVQKESSISTGALASELVREFQGVRAGFLSNCDAVAPRLGDVNVGDVVVGYSPVLQHGVLQFNAEDSTEEGRISIMGHLAQPPRVVQEAVNEMATSPDWRQKLRRLEQPDANGSCRSSPTTCQPSKIYRGMIGSSKYPIQDSGLLENIAIKNDLLCFETEAASIKNHLPFLVVCGACSLSGASSDEKYLASASEVTAAYIVCLLQLLDTVKLGQEVPMSTFFEHECFDLDRLGFRLLRLEAGTGSALKCHIFQAYLEDRESVIPYEALSYVWGSNDLSESIYANGKILRVTYNLRSTLLKLRNSSEDRILWVDAICIDQTNLEERGHQVKQMGLIFAQAERVLFWLGPGNYEAKLVMSSLSRLAKLMLHPSYRDWSNDDPRWQKPWNEIHSSCIPSSDLFHAYQRSTLDEIHVSGLQHLMEASWFQRVWILQEVANARTAFVGCHTGWAEARSFTIAPKLLGVDIDAQCQAVLDLMPGPSRKSSWWSQEQTLCTLLWRFRGCKATDPRDRVFALLGLASDTKGKDVLQATYTKSEEAVVREVFSYLFQDEVTVGGPEIRTIANLQANLPHLSRTVMLSKLQSRLGIKELETYVHRQGEVFSADEEILAVGSLCSTAIFGLLLDRKGSHDSISENLTKKAIRRGAETLKLLLDRRGDEVRITAEVVEAAARRGVDALEVLLNRRGDEVRITSEVVEAAARRGADTLEVLLNRRGGEVRITAEVVKAAAQVEADALELLLEAIRR